MYTTRRRNKYGAKKTEYNNRKFDSKHEAAVAHDLEMEKRAGLIADYDCQYKVYMHAYSKCGTYKLEKTHKIDFRIHNLDGSYTLLEAKGAETADYKDRRRWLETFWLPLNLDHDYQVIYCKSNRKLASSWAKKR